MLIKSLMSQSGQTVEVGRVTVMVGANNTGKTEALRDIFRLITNAEPGQGSLQFGTQPHTIVLRDLELAEGLSQAQLLRGLQAVVDDEVEETHIAGLGPTLRGSFHRTIGADAWHALRRPRLEARALWKTGLSDLLMLRVTYLDAPTRLAAIETSPAISPADLPENLLQALEQAHPAVHEELRKAVGFILRGQQIQLDETQRVRLTLRMASALPARSEDPVEAVQQMSRIAPLEDQGDGCKNIVAIILGLLLGEGRAVLIDQPEAFLHPIQARMLGEWIGQQAQRLYCQVFVATHSSDFLSGLLATNSDVNIVRLTRRDEQTRLHPVSSEVARELAQSPLSSIQPVLDCLFHNGVVVAKADADRAIYQMVAQRHFEAEEFIFIQAYGKRNLAYVIKLLRSAKVPACVIADLDILDSKARFNELVEVVTGQPPLRAWSSARDKLGHLIEGSLDPAVLRANTEEMEQLLDRLTWGQNEPVDEGDRSARAADAVLKWSRLRHGGLDVVPEDLRPWVKDIVSELKTEGLFIVPRGELEAWMDVGVNRERKQEWFIKAVYALRAGEQPKELIQFLGEVIAHLRRQTQV